MENFSLTSQPTPPEETNVRVSLRRMRPSRPIRMHLQSAKPAFFHDGADRYGVQACLRSMAYQRLLVVSKQMGSGRVGRSGYQQSWRVDRLPDSSRSIEEAMAIGCAV